MQLVNPGRPAAVALCGTGRQLNMCHGWPYHQVMDGSQASCFNGYCGVNQQCYWPNTPCVQITTYYNGKTCEVFMQVLRTGCLVQVPDTMPPVLEYARIVGREILYGDGFSPQVVALCLEIQTSVSTDPSETPFTHPREVYVVHLAGPFLVVFKVLMELMQRGPTARVVHVTLEDGSSLAGLAVPTEHRQWLREQCLLVQKEGSDQGNRKDLGADYCAMATGACFVI